MLTISSRPIESIQAVRLYTSAFSAADTEEQTIQESNPREPRFSREDSLSVSPEAAARLQEPSRGKGSADKEESEKKGRDGKPLSEEEKKSVEKLKERDREVKAHEQAHMAAGGQHVRGGASYSYQSGPDGGQYAIGGEVNIDTSPVSGDPDATIRKMQAVRAAAMAPAEPSGQDRSVASSAAQAMAQAQKLQETSESSESGKTDADSAEKRDSAAKPTRSAYSAYTQSLNTAGSHIDIAA